MLDRVHVPSIELWSSAGDCLSRCPVRSVLHGRGNSFRRAEIEGSASVTRQRQNPKAGFAGDPREAPALSR